MTTGAIREGDIVRCNVRGDRFWAHVLNPLEMNDALKKQVVTVASLTGRPIPTMHVTAKQIIGHWKKRKGSEL